MGDLAPHLQTLQTLSRLVAANASTGRVWLTEIGNVNPWGDVRTAADMVTPVFTALKSGAVPEVDAWYFFKARGDDSKFRYLQSANGGIGGAVITALRTASLLSTLPQLSGYRIVGTQLTLNDLAVLNDMLQDYLAQTPTQGLLDQQGGLREVGRRYLALARGAPPVLSPGWAPARMAITVDHAEVALVLNGQSIRLRTRSR